MLIAVATSLNRVDNKNIKAINAFFDLLNQDIGIANDEFITALAKVIKTAFPRVLPF